MQAAPFHWPTKEDYDMAMEAISENILDEEVKKGTIKKDNTSTLRLGGAGLYVALYPIGNLMVRCFCKTPEREPPQDISRRYQHIDEFTKRMSHVPALVPVTFVREGIQVDYLDRSNGNYVLLGTKVLPFVKMPFIYGQSLGGFINMYHKNPERMEKLCVGWMQLVSVLEDINMAHGDLDLTNVIVTQDRNLNITLKVIDYDNTWIPALARGYEQTEGGHEHFQHPAFSSKSTRPFNALMDRFSALTIYISLKALRYSPDLYKEWGVDELHRLLFSKEDYKEEIKGTRNRITMLREKKIADLEPMLAELSLCLKENRMPCSLKAFSPVQFKEEGRGQKQVTPDFYQRVTEWDGGVSDPDERESVFYDWGRLEEVPSVFPGTPLPRPREVERGVPVPDFYMAEQRGQQYGMEQPRLYMPPPRPQKRGWSAGAIILAVIIVLVILAIIVGILVATRVITFASATMYHESDMVLFSFLKIVMKHEQLFPLFQINGT